MSLLDPQKLLSVLGRERIYSPKPQTITLTLEDLNIFPYKGFRFNFDPNPIWLRKAKREGERKIIE